MVNFPNPKSPNETVRPPWCVSTGPVVVRLAESVFAHLLLMGDPQRLAASRPFRPAPSCKFDRKLKERFGEDWVPAEMSEEDAARLQGAARRAVEARASSCAGEHAI